MITREHITAVILAGGKSSRMGRDKALLRFGDRTFLENMIRLVSPFVKTVLISSGNPEHARFGVPVIGDEIPDAGPMGGLVSAGSHSDTDFIFLFSCDIPLLQPSVLQKLIGSTDPTLDAVVPTHGGTTEPLCALYHRRTLELFRDRLQKGKLKMREVLDHLKVLYIEFPEQNEGAYLRNVNTPNDLETLNDPHP